LDQWLIESYFLPVFERRIEAAPSQHIGTRSFTQYTGANTAFIWGSGSTIEIAELYSSQQFRKYAVSRMIATTETESENRRIPPSRIAGTAEKSIPHASQ
jgi:hypothetical protein